MTRLVLPSTLMALIWFAASLPSTAHPMSQPMLTIEIAQESLIKLFGQLGKADEFWQLEKTSVEAEWPVKGARGQLQIGRWNLNLDQRTFDGVFGDGKNQPFIEVRGKLEFVNNEWKAYVVEQINIR